MSEAQQQPWWKFGHVWLVLAGPIVAVVSGLGIVWIALAAPDPVLATKPAVQSQSLAPAQQARNHAQTGLPVPKEARP